jgi:hypothetical protein
MTRKDMQEKLAVVYLPTKADLQRWQALSRSKGSSLSSWIFEMVELALEERHPSTKATSPEEVNALNRENFELKKAIEQLTKQNEQLRMVIRIPPSERFKDSVEALLKKGGTWNGQKLKEGLKPYSDKDGSLNVVLRGLIDSGKVDEGEKGFKWKKK